MMSFETTGYMQHRLLYRFACATSYSEDMNNFQGKMLLLDMAASVAKRYKIKIPSMGGEPKHIHFFIQANPTYSAQVIVATIQKEVALDVQAKMPKLVEKNAFFWGNNFSMKTIGEDEFNLRLCDKCVVVEVSNMSDIKALNKVFKKEAKEIKMRVIDFDENYLSENEITSKSLTQAFFESLAIEVADDEYVIISYVYTGFNFTKEHARQFSEVVSSIKDVFDEDFKNTQLQEIPCQSNMKSSGLQQSEKFLFLTC